LALFKKALTRYVDCLNANLRFTSPAMELVFWERLGRAAAWSEEWAISTMATRRAIVLAKKQGLPARLAQLHGTLSLAYDQANEEDYAREALASSAAELEASELQGKLVIAKRNRAAAKLDVIALRTPEVIDSALEDLRSARALVAKVG